MRRSLLVLLFLAPFPAAAQDSVLLPDIVVQARRLDEARTAISPTLGASVSSLKRETIENLPQGADAPVNQLLLQFPGVVQDSFGEIHVRGEHRNLQYRVNGVTLPVGIQGFGAFLDARAIAELRLLTGALPAQFGYRTGGVVDITLRSGASDPGGWVSAYGGSYSTFQPSIGYAGLHGGWDVFATGTFRQSRLGIEPPTSSTSPLHNRTEQLRGLVSVSRLLTDNVRLSVIGGTSANRFQMPNNPGQPIEFPVIGEEFDSARLRARQWERNRFGVVALQGSSGALDWQVAGFGRDSTIRYLPDLLGELAFNGVASQVQRRSTAFGVQADGSYRLNDRNTLRFGVMSMGERSFAGNVTTLLPLDADGEVAGDPFSIVTRRGRTSWVHGIYLQNEFRVSERLTINAGLRGDYADQAVRAGQLSPRMNLVWRPMDRTTLTLGYARYFTPPAQELISPGDVSLFAGTTNEPENFRADLPRPERSHYFSAGISQRVTDRLTLGASAWHKEARDLLDLGQFGRALVFTPFNYRQGRSTGIEFTGQWRGERLDLYANLTISRASGRDIRTSQFNFEPEELDYVRNKWVRTDHDQLLTASAGAVWRAWEGGRISATLLFGSGLRRGFANTEKQDPYATLNVGLAHDFTLPGAGRWTARLDLLNLADARTQLRDGSGIGVGAPQFLPRRAIYGGLTRHF
ncbi:TonB-dependent receptor [Sabulicella rubraurantiaca]|uniref:TonB-dependent receptor n=1 Tax=Sabulicella rubraurantiaca TaxID=2811429 RepID=UPI001A969274|nr:TonB-dependent receptor [Sabulicella rubraurantiaca]